MLRLQERVEMENKKKIYAYVGIGVVVAIAIAVAISLTSVNPPTTVASDQESSSDVNSLPVKVGYIDLPLALPTYVAQENGIFEKYGIKAELIPFRTGDSMMEAIVSGQIDMYYGGSTTNLLAVEERTPGSLQVFHMQTYSAEEPGTHLVVKNDSSLTEPSQMNGKKVAIFPSSTSKVLTELYFEKVLGPEHSVALVQVSPLDWSQALATGSVDAILAYEPFASFMVADGIGKVIVTEPWGESVITDVPIANSAFSAAFVENNPQAAESLVKVFDEAVMYIEDNGDESRQLFLKYSRIVTENSLALVPLYTSWDRPNEESIQRFQELADLLVSHEIHANHIDVRNTLYRVDGGTS